MFPPVPEKVIDAGYHDFADRWNSILDVFDENGIRFAHEADVRPPSDEQCVERQCSLLALTYACNAHLAVRV